MATKKLALLGSSCEATGHPTDCQEPATGKTQDADSVKSVTINGSAVSDHGDVMHFGSHAHEYKDTDGDGSKECTTLASHDLVPDDSPSFTINGNPVVRVGDKTTDPDSGGDASVVDSGGNSAVTHTSA